MAPVPLLVDRLHGVSRVDDGMVFLHMDLSVLRGQEATRALEAIESGGGAPPGSGM